MPDENGKFTASDLKAYKEQLISGKRVKHGDKEVENHSADEAARILSLIESESSATKRPVRVSQPKINTSWF